MYKILTTFLLTSLLFISGCQKPLTIQNMNVESVQSVALYQEDFKDISEWTAFFSKNSSIEVGQVMIDNSPCLKLSFKLGDWGGIGKSFSKKYSWNIKNSVVLRIKGDSSSNIARIEITDNGGERFIKLVPINFQDWKIITIPLNEFKHRQDWQPDKAPMDGFTLTAVEGISISPTLKGSGVWLISDLKVIP
ncbi:MAG: carbohydrate binding domain-containing protein [Candidatus Margulisbacteria bacterium]|nr:carbohydrate binding domain-containing protein [Candidatus Margulisiibacteriota bacterium]